MADANEKYIRKVTIPSEKTLATVGAWPGEVIVTVEAYDNSLKPNEARALAQNLLLAADDAEIIKFVDESLETMELTDERV